MDIYVLKDGQQMGPFGEPTLRELIKGGQVGSLDLAWYPGIKDWVPLSTLLPAAAPASRQRKGSRPVDPILAAGIILAGIGFLGTCFGLKAGISFLGSPFFLAAFVLSIVSICRGRAAAGMTLLVITILIAGIGEAVISADRRQAQTLEETERLLNQ